MADDFGTFPFSMFDDVEDLPLDEVGVFVALMGLANDHGLFEGRVAALARRFARDMSDLRPRIEALVRRNLIAFYDAPLDGRVVRVGEIVGFFRYRGHAETRSNPSRRRKSDLPLRDGSYPEFRGHSSADDNGPAPKKRRGTSAEPPRKSRGTSAEPPRKSRGTSAEPPRQREEKRGEEKRDPRASHSDQGAPPRRAPEPSPPGSTDARAIGGPVPVAPSPSALGGAAVGAPMGEPPSPRPEGPMTRRLREEAEQRQDAERKAAEIRALAIAALEASRRAPDKPLDDPEALRRAAADKLAEGRLALPPPEQSDEPDEEDWDHVQALVAARSFVVVGVDEEATCLPD